MSTYQPYSKISGKTDGPAILLLNSLGTTTQMWQGQLPLLEKHLRVVQLDTRGHGQSPTPSGPYDFKMLIDDAFNTMDKYGIQSFSVMGCSLGSMTALGMGIHNPERIEKIICSAARADSPAPFRQSWYDRIDVIKKNGVSALWEGSLGNWLTPAFREAYPETIDQMKEEFLKTTDDGYCGCAMALKDLNFLKDLKVSKIPTLFVAGSEDKGAAPATMNEMAQVTPNAEFAIIADAGHIINVNKPDEFNKVISSYLGLADN